LQSREGILGDGEDGTLLLCGFQLREREGQRALKEEDSMVSLF